MVVRLVTAPDNEPDNATFEMPSAKEHLFQVVDFIEQDDPDIVLAKFEVVGGEEEGRSLLNRLSLDSSWKGFFATRLFLKAVGLPYKGEIDIDTEDWIGRQFYATVVHNGSNGKTYANIKEYNFEKVVENKTQHKPTSETVSKQEIAWDE